MTKRPNYGALSTEAHHPRACRLETLALEEVVTLLVSEERRSVAAALGRRREIVKAVKLIVAALKQGGRLFYVGAGTSGRIGALDAAELPPTFSSDPSQVIAVMAGGHRALHHAVEGAEDRGISSEKRLAKHGLSDKDVVCAIAASGVTPFARRALEYARRVGAHTIFITFAKVQGRIADVVIASSVGPEVIAGSTRLKAGTATKLILNAISTTTMVALGKVYGGRMVDLRPTTRKLRDRAERMTATLCGVDRKTARALLKKARYRPKVAIAMHTLGVDEKTAELQLAEAGGDLHRLHRKRNKRR